MRETDAILHAGDVGGAHVLDALRELAPLTYVAGNNDDSDGTSIIRVTIGDVRILLTHILPRPHKPDARVIESLRKRPADIVIFGHSHLPHNEIIDGACYFNPASAGPRRFNYPVSVGIIEDGRPMHVALDERSKPALKERSFWNSCHQNTDAPKAKRPPGGRRGFAGSPESSANLAGRGCR